MTAVTQRPTTRPASGPRPRGRGPRLLGWTLVATLLLGGGALGVALAGALRTPESAAGDPESAAPDGMRALTNVLSGHGVAVTVVRDVRTATAALDEPATLVLPDDPLVSDDEMAALADRASDVVMVRPGARGLRVLFGKGEITGVADGGPVAPECTLPDAVRAGPATVGASIDVPDAQWRCYPAAGGYGLIVRDRPAGRTVVVDASTVFTNQHLTSDGNAALALNLLGRTGRVVWLAPAAGAAGAAASGDLGAVTPDWVTPAIVLLVGATAAAAVWRGRRFGPLVAERLPVVVPATETTVGRGRLYARSRDAARAARLLQDGTRRRLGMRLGLGPDASAAAVAQAAAARSGRTSERIREMLEAVPAGDRALAELAASLARLEDAVEGER